MNDKIKSLIFAVIFSMVVVGTIMVFAMSLGEVQKENIKTYHDICEEIKMDYLSVTKQLFGDDYVICHNQSNDEIKKIPI